MTDAKKVVERSWQALRVWDLDAWMECYAEDAELSVPGVQARGRDSIRSTWQVFLDAFPDDSPTVERIAAEADIVFGEFHSVGTNTGPLAGLLVYPTGDTSAPTGRHVDLRGVIVCEVENGKIRRERWYWDRALLAEQLGLIPQPDTAGT